MTDKAKEWRQVICGLILFITLIIYFNRNHNSHPYKTIDVLDKDEVRSTHNQSSTITGHTCYECGRECKSDSEMSSEGDISTNYVPYHLCGSEECLNSHYQRVRQAQLNIEPL